MSHEIKGEAIYAFVILSVGTFPSPKLKQELIAFVRAEIGPIVTIDVIQFAKGVPKTRSGKIMRRILRKIAVNDVHDLGDTNTLTNREVTET